MSLLAQPIHVPCSFRGACFPGSASLSQVCRPALQEDARLTSCPPAFLLKSCLQKFLHACLSSAMTCY